MIKRFLSIGMLVLVGFQALAASGENEPSQGRVAFGLLSSLEGLWQGEYANGSEHQVEYRLLARGSVLTETWTMASGSQSMTVYSMSGNELVATHYCPQGNQPRLSLSEFENGKLVFKVIGGDNLTVPGRSHQSRLELHIGKQGFQRSEDYQSNQPPRRYDKGEMVSYHRLESTS